MLTEFQRELLRLLAANRSPNSVFAGGAVLNREGSRLSRDLDIEQYSVEATAASFQADRSVLEAHGYEVEVSGGYPLHRGHIQAVASGGQQATRLEWTTDSAVKFFPAVEDEEFGWCLHPLDLATNKILALAGRREPRDYFDIVQLQRGGITIAALAWAAFAKDAGLTPELILDEIARNSNYTATELKAIQTTEPIDPVALKRDFLAGIAEARDLFARLPYEQAGHLYLDHDRRACRPDAKAVETKTLVLHGATVGGAWPTIPGAS